MLTEQLQKEAVRQLLAPHTAAVEEDLRRWLVEPGTPAALAEAMRYCVLDGGKRLRPALVWMSAQVLGGGDRQLTRRSAVAVELVHCYSLVHDDLPAMDDDTIRRGRATAHVKFGQAMAILVGDALLTRAFGILAEADGPLAAVLAGELAAGAGPAGMIAGQVADMHLCDVPDDMEGLHFIHLRKTAALIRAAARMGALCANARPDELAAISEFAESLGLAFQLIDDMLDVTGRAEIIGKTPGKDARSGKRTGAAEVGLDRAARRVRELTEKAASALEPMGGRADPLAELVRLLARRTY